MRPYNYSIPAPPTAVNGPSLEPPILYPKDRPDSDMTMQSAWMPRNNDHHVVFYGTDRQHCQFSPFSGVPFPRDCRQGPRCYRRHSTNRGDVGGVRQSRPNHRSNHWSSRGSVGSSSSISSSDSDSGFQDNAWTRVMGGRTIQPNAFLACASQSVPININCGPQVRSALGCAPQAVGCGSQVHSLVGGFDPDDPDGFGTSLVCVTAHDPGRHAGITAIMNGQCGGAYPPQYWVAHGNGQPRCWARWGCGQWWPGREDGCCLVGLCAASNRLAHLLRGLFNS